MRIGRFSPRQRWIDRAVSPSLTAIAVLLMRLGVSCWGLWWRVGRSGFPFFFLESMVLVGWESGKAK